jgi:hypothetical protein
VLACYQHYYGPEALEKPVHGTRKPVGCPALTKVSLIWIKCSVLARLHHSIMDNIIDYGAVRVDSAQQDSLCSPPWVFLPI